MLSVIDKYTPFMPATRFLAKSAIISAAIVAIQAAGYAVALGVNAACAALSAHLGFTVIHANSAIFAFIAPPLIKITLAVMALAAVAALIAAVIESTVLHP